MALLSILKFPDKRLRTKAATVDVVDDSVRETLDNMLETMYAAPGIGLAATQVNIHKRMVVIDVSEDKNDPVFLINPEITRRSDSTEVCEEGCLSVPEYYAEVARAAEVTIKALDRDGKVFELDADGLLAVCVQHELDHLDGKLFVDYLSPLKQQRLKKKLAKMARQNAA